ncbi:GNAT family acetyltransferase [Herbiconiux sp. CPCC 205716]|uniref:GNAT family acetyltransferase n=1 Tax=Herbiconiux gentiana TaxID=2970912 RepID=A0ABT2GG64_9MICO|nr:GNAT family acetyltransferase [Herbiconiux gentiana]MCS5713791.1 GNAT family acetyltransferase [Herbiconiux gentiana]
MARQRDVDDQRQRLSEATWAVLTERGLPGLTIRAVAERAGCTTGLVMHAFPTKDALLLHARDLLHAATRLRADAAEAAAATPGQALEAVLLNALSLDDRSADEARVWVSYLAAALADPTLAERHRAGNRSFVARVERLLGASRPAWSAERIRTEARTLVAVAEGMNTLGAADPETYPPEVQRRSMTDALSRTLGPADAGRPAAPDPLQAGGAGLSIRPFDEADTEQVVTLWAACGLTRPWNDPHRDIARKLTVQPELFLVGVDTAGAVVASAMAGFDGHRGWVNYLAVTPARQGHGDGRALMHEVEQRLLALGCPKVNLQIREGNEGVMEFYRTLSYTRDAAVSFGKRLIPDA